MRILHVKPFFLGRHDEFVSAAEQSNGLGITSVIREKDLSVEHPRGRANQVGLFQRRRIRGPVVTRKPYLIPSGIQVLGSAWQMLALQYLYGWTRNRYRFDL